MQSKSNVTDERAGARLLVEFGEIRALTDKPALLHHPQEVGSRLEHVRQTLSFNDLGRDLYGRLTVSATLVRPVAAGAALSRRAVLTRLRTSIRLPRGAPVMSTEGAPSELPAPIAPAPDS